jgi:hypothetical protein
MIDAVVCRLRGVGCAYSGRSVGGRIVQDGRADGSVELGLKFQPTRVNCRMASA